MFCLFIDFTIMKGMPHIHARIHRNRIKRKHERFIYFVFLILLILDPFNLDYKNEKQE